MPISEVEMARRKAENDENEARKVRMIRATARANFDGNDQEFESAFPEILRQIRIGKSVSAVQSRTPIATID